MAGSAAVYFIASLALLFLPAEIVTRTGMEASPVLLQLISGGLYGFAMLNWMLRYSTIGGIYHRPVIVANLGHAVIGSMSLLRAGGGWPVVVVAAIYALIAIGFGRKLFAKVA